VALFALLVIANLLPIWAANRFPSQNGPWFLSTVRMFRDMDQEGTRFAEYFVRSWHPIPHMLHHTLILGVSSVTSLPTAEKIVLSLHVLLMPLSLLLFVRTVAPGRTGIGLLGFLMIFTYPFMRGYHNFSLSIPLYFLTLTYWLRVRTLEPIPLKHWVGLAAMTVLVYLSHLLAFGLLFGTIGWYELVTERRPVRATLRAIGVTWAGWLLFLDYEWITRTQAQWINKEDTLWMPFHWNLQYFFERYFYSVSPVAFVAAVIGWSCLLALIVTSFRTRSDSNAHPLRTIFSTPFASLAVLLAVAYLTMPYKFLGWHKVSVRLVPFIIGLTLASAAFAIPPQAWRRWRYPFLGMVTLASLTVATGIGLKVAEIGRVIDTYVAGTQHMEPGSRFLPIHLSNPAYGNVRPFTRVYEHYLIDTGSVHGGSIAWMNTLAIVWYRRYPISLDFPVLPDQGLPLLRSLPTDDEMANTLAEYDYALVMGHDDKLFDQIARCGFQLEFENELVHLFRASPTGDSVKTPNVKDTLTTEADVSNE